MATSFRCAAVGCYSYESKATHETFQALQSYLNRFSRAVGFAPMAVDGIIGVATTTAAQATARAMAASGAGPQIVGQATPMVGIAATPQMLAQGAEHFLAFLKIAAQAAQLPAVVAPSGPPAGSPPQQNPIVSAMPGFEPVKKLNKIYVAAGAIFGFAILIGGYQIIKHRL